uniref:Uncharacterized protein n=1 Tax=Ciona savignyi TaxID=51511 RepID=H2Z6A7_CIOSA
METQQIASTIFVPALCSQFNQGYSNYDVTNVTKQQLLQPLHSGQHLLLPSSGYPLFVQMHQVLPFLPQDPTMTSQYTDILPHRAVMLQTGIPPIHSLNPAITAKNPEIHNLTQTAIHNDVTISQTLHRTQRKKKISPSAKRRSRLRLIAFLESKKEKEPVVPITKNNENDDTDTIPTPSDVIDDVIETPTLPADVAETRQEEITSLTVKTRVAPSVDET